MFRQTDRQTDKRNILLPQSWPLSRDAYAFLQLTSVEGGSGLGDPGPEASLDKAGKAKAAVLRRLLRRLPAATPPDAAALLRQLAIGQGGLLLDAYRAAVWPRLAAVHPAGPAACDDDASSDGYFSTDSSVPAADDADDADGSELEEPELPDEDLQVHSAMA